MDLLCALIGVDQAKFLFKFCCAVEHALLVVRHEFVAGDRPVPVDVAPISRDIGGEGHASLQSSVLSQFGDLQTTSKVDELPGRSALISIISALALFILPENTDVSQ